MHRAQVLLEGDRAHEGRHHHVGARGGIARLAPVSYTHLTLPTSDLV